MGCGREGGEGGEQGEEKGVTEKEEGGVEGEEEEGGMATEAAGREDNYKNGVMCGEQGCSADQEPNNGVGVKKQEGRAGKKKKQQKTERSNHEKCRKLAHMNWGCGK